MRACVCVLCSRFSWRYRFLLYWCRYSYKNAIEFWQRREETISPVKKISGYKIVWDSEGRMRRWRALDGNQLQRGRGLERNKANRVTSEPNWNTDHRDDVERRDDNNSAHDVHKQEERASEGKERKWCLIYPFALPAAAAANRNNEIHGSESILKEEEEESLVGWNNNNNIVRGWNRLHPSSLVLARVLLAVLPLLLAHRGWRAPPP